MTARMFQRGFLMLCLLAASLVASTVTHARELPGALSIECAGTVHTESEKKQAPGDLDRGMSHHHGCHSASSFMPWENPASHSFDASSKRFVPAQDSALASGQSGPDLRPPIA